MQFSTRARYGLRAMVELALCYGDGPVPLLVLAQKQKISESYLEQLLRTMRKGGLVTTVRGASGGYALALPPEQITAETALKVLEGSTTVTDCVGKESGQCDRACECSARPLFIKLQAKINAVLADTTIADLASDYREQMRRIEDAKSIS